MNISKRSLLKRRAPIFSTFQAGIDGLLVIGLTYTLSLLFFDFLPISYFVFSLVLMATMGVVYDRFGIYRHNGNIYDKAILLGKAWAISFSILMAIAFLSNTLELFSRSFLVIFFICGFIAQILNHVLSRYLFSLLRPTQVRAHALLIGTGTFANHLYQRINHNPWLSDMIIGAVEVPSGVAQSEETEKFRNDENPPILGGLDDMSQLLKRHDIRSVYIAVPMECCPSIESIYFSLLDKNVNVHWAPNIFTLNLLNHSVTELAGIPLINLSETPLAGTNLVWKALEDKVLSMLALALASPVMLLAAVAIKLDTPGPIFFKQSRTGWDGRNFAIWKFRTMRVHEPEEGVIKQATKEDPRITRVGRFLRQSSIDELPQLLNVLQGSMSMVGPRPHAISHNEHYSKQIKVYLARHRIKPGITGLAQVRGFRGETKELEQMRKRVESDLEYINNWSIMLDITILFRTVLVLFSKNAY